MADLPRLNNVIRALEAGQHALTCFAPAHVDSAIAMSASKYDGCVFEMEHNPWDSGRLRDCLQYMLNRAQIAKAGLVPPVTPMVRIPVNGVEMAQWQAKQALDIGCYGIVFPHISTVEEAANAVGACRYPRMKNAPLYEPAGIRGDGPTAAARYWGVGQQEYYQKADVWPLNPQGEIFCILQIEDTRGVENLDDMLKKVPGIGAILIGEGDLVAGARLSAPVRAQGRAGVDEAHRRHLQEAQRRGRPSARRDRQRRAHRQGRLPLPDDGAGAELRPLHGRAKSHRADVEAPMKIGLVGLGRMGRAIQARLTANGFDVIGLGSRRRGDEVCRRASGAARRHPRAVADAADGIVISIITEDHGVRGIFRGKDGFLSGDVQAASCSSR